MDENQDLAKQYQDILDRYSRELIGSAAPVTETTKPSETVEPPIALEPSMTEALPQPAPLPIQPPIITSTPITSPTPTPPTPSNFFKYLFFFSLIIFLAVSGLIIYSMLNPGTSSQPETTIPTSKPTMPVPTVNSSQVCVVNDMNYQVGESFVADDGCNTCSCGVDLTIVCTQKACEATPSTKLVPTLKITSTPKVLTPTDIPIVDAGPLKSILTYVNSQLRTTYKEVTLDKGKTWSINLTKTSNKQSVLVIKKGITDFGLVFQENLSGEAGTDWKEVYVRNADTCSLEYVQSVLTLSCYN